MNKSSINPELNLNPPQSAEERLAHLEQVEQHMEKIRAVCVKHGYAYDTSLVDFIESRLAGQ
jgi:hypothetical protein